MTLDEKIENVEVNGEKYNIGDYVIYEYVIEGGRFGAFTGKKIIVGKISAFYGSYRFKEDGVSFYSPTHFGIEGGYIIQKVLGSSVIDILPEKLDFSLCSFEMIEDPVLFLEELKEKITKKRYGRLINEEV